MSAGPLRTRMQNNLLNALQKLQHFFVRAFAFNLKHHRLSLLIHGLIFLLASCALLKLKFDFSLAPIHQESSHNASINRAPAPEDEIGRKVIVSFVSKSGPVTERLFCDLLNWRSDLALKAKNWDFSSYAVTDLKIPNFVNSTLGFKDLLPIDCHNLSSNVLNFSNTNSSLLPYVNFFYSPTQPNRVGFLFKIFQPAALRTTSPFKTPFGELKQSLEEAGLEKNWQFEFLGQPVFEEAIVSGILGNIWLNGIFCGLLIVLFRLFIGTWTSGFIAFIPIQFSAVLIHGLMAVFGQKMNIVISLVYLMISLAALEDFVYISGRNQSATPRSWRSICAFIMPSFFTSLTTFVGFAALATSELTVLREFGIWTALATMIEWYACFFVLPAVLKQWPLKDGWTKKDRAPVLALVRKLAKFQPPRIFLVPFVLILVAGLGLAAKLNFSSRYDRIFPKNNFVNESIRSFSSLYKWSGAFDITLQENISAIQKSELKKSLLNFPAVTRLDDSEEFLKSWSELVPAKNAAWFSTQARSFPFWREFIDPNGHHTLTIYTNTMNFQELNQISDQAFHFCQSIAGRCSPSGELLDFLKLGKATPNTFFSSFALSLVLVFSVLLLLSIATKAQSTNATNAIFAILVSACWGPAAMVLLLSVSQTEINFFNAIFASILMGLAGDSAIQFLFGSSKSASLHTRVNTRSEGAILMALFMALSAIPFLFSEFRPVHDLGIILVIGLLLSLIGDLWGLRLLLQIRKIKD